jgi:adenylate kinase family enzyme
MKKVNVIGTTGSGKSSFSKRLANVMDAQYIHMDQLFWKPDWVESTDVEFFPKLEQALSQSSWVLDGNYSRTNPIKWAHADTIIWIDYAYSRTFFQLLKRTIVRATSKRELWVGTGNKESLVKSFMSKKSILLWFFKNYRKNKTRYSELMRSPTLQNVSFIRLQSPKQVNQFLKSLNVD